MAFPTYVIKPFANDFVDTLTSRYYWVGSDIYYSISDGFSGEYFTSSSVAANTFGAALNAYAEFANLSFTYSGYYSDPLTAYNYGSDLNWSLDFSYLFFNSNAAWARGFFPDNTQGYLYYAGEDGDIYFNGQSQITSLQFPSPGNEAYMILLHEIGHTLGLKHPHDGGGTGSPTFREFGLEFADVEWFTLMSYNDGYPSSFEPVTPMVGDVIALQYLYGKNYSTYAGNSTHNVIDSGNYRTIWDASGNDTVSASSQNIGWYIELPNFQPSTVVDTLAGVAMPLEDYVYLQDYNLDPLSLYWLTGNIENVVGGNGADYIVGNSFNNILSGNGGVDAFVASAGYDRIDGGLGNEDYIIFQGVTSNMATIAKSGATTTIAVSSMGSTSVLQNVEYAQFSDRVIDLQAIVVEPSNPTVVDNQIYRFYNTESGTHFYTGSSAERDWIMSSFPNFIFEGASFKGVDSTGPNAIEFYRFYNNQTGTHFFTSSAEERDMVISTLPQFSYEGVAYHLNSSADADDMALYRFFNTQTGTHFYTAAEAEKDSLISTLNPYLYEGIVGYVDVV